MGPRQADAAVAAVIFAMAAIWGWAFYTGYVKTGHHPFFYQSYFEPAVMVACGKGFVVSESQPPALRAFVLEQTDRFSCDELPPDLTVGTKGLYQRPWRYLMTTVGVVWRVVGISWSGLAPLFGVFYGATTALAYALCRLIAGRAAAVACAAALCVSTLQLTNLPNLRDYAKAPFTLALVLILVALVVRPWRTRDVLLLSLGYGLVMGVGYGFRTDVLVNIPPFLATVALFMPGGIVRNPGMKLAAVGVFAFGFLAAGWPIITTVASGGGCQWHVFLLGLASPFNDALGVAGGSYGWGHLYKDEYLWATVSSYATRFRPDLGYIEYCSHQYDVASWEYLRHILITFPADMVTRAYAAVLQVLDLPFRRFDPPFAHHLVLFYRIRAFALTALTHTGPFLAAAFVLTISWSSLRQALFAVFVILYFGGHPAIQFLPRHYFPFEFITWAMLAFLVERAVCLGVALVRNRSGANITIERRGRKGRKAETVILSGLRGLCVLTSSRGTDVASWIDGRPIAGVRRVAVCAAAALVMLLVPPALLRWYQQGRAMRLLESYIAASTSPMPMQTVAPGRFRLSSEAGDTRTPSQIEAVAALGRSRASFLEAEFDAAACVPGTTVTFQYDPTYQATDFSHAVPLQTRGQAMPTRLFEPVYAGFRGIDVSDPAGACFRRLLVVKDADQFPLLLPAELPPGWESEPQYQRIAGRR